MVSIMWLAAVFTTAGVVGVLAVGWLYRPSEQPRSGPQEIECGACGVASSPEAWHATGVGWDRECPECGGVLP